MDTIENVSAGAYTVELKNEFLCVVRQEIEILQPDSLYFDSLQIQNIMKLAKTTEQMHLRLLQFNSSS